MRKQVRLIERTATRIRQATSVGAALVCALVSAPVYAQTPATSAAGPWVSATLISVLSVFALWIGAVGFFVIARRFRWISSHRHSRLSRAIQVAFGGLLLMAVLMPYLALNHPLVATALLMGGLLLAVSFGSTQPFLSGESQRPHS